MISPKFHIGTVGFKNALIVALSVIVFMYDIQGVNGTRGELFDQKGQKNYEEDEEGKIVPHRTFLTTVEIVLICIFTVVGVFLVVCIALCLHFYGCRVPDSWKRKQKDYSQIRLQRERKIGEIWKTNHNVQSNQPTYPI